MVTETPYVGPRPFQPEDRDRFFGRDQEASALLSLSVAHRVVLLYAPSGAGKSSLLNAMVLPLLAEEGFDVLPTARVRGPALQEIAVEEVDNLYVFYTLLSLSNVLDKAESVVAQRFTQENLSDFLEEYPRREDDFGHPLPRVLIFDQFEELFTAYPERWRDREQFFSQVRKALEKDRLLHVLFSMREDYVAQLDAYADMLPGHLRHRFRLERMQPRAALEAVRRPLAKTERAFGPGVAEQLVEDLRKTRVEAAGGETGTVTGEFVEPVQLQVVCQNLWQDLPEEVETITSEHLRTFGNIDQALAAFYERAVRAAVREAEIGEAALREWFEEQLLTPTGTRSTVHRGPQTTAGIPNRAVETLENQHLLRGEWRAGARWYELTHDRLIDPIRAANRRWTEARRERQVGFLLRVAGAVVLLLLVALAWSWLSEEPATAMEAGALETATAEARSAATVRAEATAGALTATREFVAASTRAAATATSQALVVGATATRQMELAEATARIRATVDSQTTATTVARATTDAYATATTIARATVDAQATAIAAQSVASSPARPLRPGVSIGDVDSQSAGTLSAFVRDANGSVHMLLVWPFARESGTIIVQPSPIDGGQPITHEVGTVSIQAGIPANGSSGPATVPGAEAVGMARLDEQMSFLASPAEALPLTGVGSPEAGMAVTVTGRTSGRIAATITAISTTHTLNDDEGAITLADLFVLDRAVIAGDQGALVMDDEGNLVGVVLANAGPAASVAVPIRPVLARLNAALVGLGSPLATLAEEQGELFAVTLNPAGDRIATAGVEGVRLWDLEGNELAAFRRGRELQSVAFHPDGERLIAASTELARIWDITDTDWEAWIPHTRITSALFSPDGKRVLTGGADGLAKLWETMGYRWVRNYNHESPVRALAFSPTGDRLVTAGDNGVLKVWDIGGAPLQALAGHEGRVWQVQFSVDGQQLLSAGEDGTARIWNVETGEMELLLEGHDGAVRAAAFHPTTSYLLTAGTDSSIRVWDLAGNEVTRIEALEAPIYAAIYDANGERIVTAGQDGAVRLWQGR